MGTTFDTLDDVSSRGPVRLARARYSVVLISGTGCMGLALGAWESLWGQRATSEVVIYGQTPHSSSKEYGHEHGGPVHDDPCI